MLPEGDQTFETQPARGSAHAQSFVGMVSQDVCAPVKCSGGTAILTIEWLDGTSCPNALPKPYAPRVRIVGRTLCSIAL